METLASSLKRSPALFPYAMDSARDLVTFVRLEERDYSAASFLDARILRPGIVSRAHPWPQIEEAVADAGLIEDYLLIFHIGHVGSTLLSRLLGKHPAIFALREPAILRTLALLQFERSREISGQDRRDERRLTAFLKLWSRTFHPDQRACIKATSFVSELAPAILARPSRPRAIFAFVPAETYLATILGGPNSRQETRILAQSRLARLERRLDMRLHRRSELSEGEMIGMSWACEMAALSAAAAAGGDRVLWWNFDRFFENPDGSLANALRHFGIPYVKNGIDEILSGSERLRYSKAPEHAYDEHLRRQVLDHARSEFARELARGLRLLDNLSAQFPAVQQAMTRAESHG